MKPGIWRRIYHTDGKCYRNVGFLPEGSLHNPNGYEETTVRTAIYEAWERKRQRRSETAKKAAITRRERWEKRVYEVAQRIVSRENLGPRHTCIICGKPVTDVESIERGIGSDCWQRVLTAIQYQQTKGGSQVEPAER